MKLLEHEAKTFFRKYEIPVPEGSVIKEPGEAESFTTRLGKPVVIKAQLPVGGRGKAGGILFAEAPRDAVDKARGLFGSEIKGIEVSKVMVEEKLDILNEVYIGVTVDRTNNCHVVLASSEGGIDIEEVAESTPEKIVRHRVDPLKSFRSFHANEIARKLGYSDGRLLALSQILQKLYTLALDMDAELTEINPLAEVVEGFIAADARLNVDNNALFRHDELKEGLMESYKGELTEREMEAREVGLTYVELEGNIGVIGNGAGLTMATLDTVQLYGGYPGNFLDLGGGADPESIEKAVKFVCSDQRIEALFVNVLGGITRCDHIAEGIISARAESEAEKPIVVRMMGTKEEEGRRILSDAGIETMDSMEEAAQRVVDLVGGDE
ncbi:MAG: ADP-forming succinate--CoA ligase subunit beta [Candidatus Bathyarchaeia archaeon]